MKTNRAVRAARAEYALVHSRKYVRGLQFLFGCFCNNYSDASKNLYLIKKLKLRYFVQLFLSYMNGTELAHLVRAKIRLTQNTANPDKESDRAT